MRQHPDEFARQVRRFGPLIAIVIFAVIGAYALINWPGNPTMLAVGIGAGLFSVALFAWGIRRGAKNNRRLWYEEQARQARERKARAADS
ncbi:MAG: hypothetical protein ACYC2K_13835 [Gemmatimonadales bacterium]